VDFRTTKLSAQSTIPETMWSRVRPIVLTVLIVGAVALIYLFTLHEYKDNQAKAEKAEAEVTKERLAEVKKKIGIGTLIVWKSDSSVTRVEGMNLKSSRVHHKKMNQPVDAVSAEVLTKKSIMVLPRRSSLSDDYGNITRYRRAALVFTDPGYDNYFKAPTH
jgi:hypothetical protein